jgi:hypothetical protein
MFVGILYVTICSGWLCRAIHGNESRIETSHRYSTKEECEWATGEAARWVIGDTLPYRIVCQKED